MSTVSEISRWMEAMAPLGLSESWDNTGLLLGDPRAAVERVMTCLTLTEATVQEAIDERASLVIAHHPLPFQALKRITTQTTVGGLLWRLAAARISVYSPHTAWDSAPAGINALLADKLQLQDLSPIQPADPTRFPGLGSGRIGSLPASQSLQQIASGLVQRIPNCRPRGVDNGRMLQRVAIACGSGGSLLPSALELGCDVLVTGEATFHTCLEAHAGGCCLLLLGHFDSERFSLVELARRLGDSHPSLHVWASRQECDPIQDLPGLGQ